MAVTHADIAEKLRLLRVPGPNSRPNSQQRSARSNHTARSLGASPTRRGASQISQDEPLTPLLDPFHRSGLPRTPPQSLGASPIRGSQVSQDDPFCCRGFPRTPPQSVGASPAHASQVSPEDPFHTSELAPAPPHSSTASPRRPARISQDDPFHRSGLPRTPPHPTGALPTGSSRSSQDDHFHCSRVSQTPPYNHLGDLEAQHDSFARSALPRMPQPGGAGRSPKERVLHSSGIPRTPPQNSGATYSQKEKSFQRSGIPRTPPQNSVERNLEDMFKSTDISRTTPHSCGTRSSKSDGGDCQSEQLESNEATASKTNVRPPPLRTRLRTDPGAEIYQSPATSLSPKKPERHYSAQGECLQAVSKGSPQNDRDDRGRQSGLPRTPPQDFRHHPGQKSGLPRTPPQNFRNDHCQKIVTNGALQQKHPEEHRSSGNQRPAPRMRSQPRHKLAEGGVVGNECDNDMEKGGAPFSPKFPPRQSAQASSSEDAGHSYLNRDELKPFRGKPNIDDLLKRLASSDWSTQFNAIDDVRRIAFFVPELLQSSALQSVAERIIVHAQSLRSTVAKNGLRCLGELFLAYGSRLDPDLPVSVITVLKRSADTNHFIAEEGDQTLRDICSSASSGRLTSLLVDHYNQKSAGLRTRAVWGLAMVTQRVGNTGNMAIAQTVVKALGDPNPNVRATARMAAMALAAADQTGRLPGVIHAAIPAGKDLSSFDARHLETKDIQGYGKTASASSAGTSSKLAHTGACLLREAVANAMPQSAPAIAEDRGPSARRPSTSTSVGPAERQVGVVPQNATTRNSRSVPAGRR